MRIALKHLHNTAYAGETLGTVARMHRRSRSCHPRLWLRSRCSVRSLRTEIAKCGTATLTYGSTGALCRVKSNTASPYPRGNDTRREPQLPSSSTGMIATVSLTSSDAAIICATCAGVGSLGDPIVRHAANGFAWASSTRRSRAVPGSPTCEPHKRSSCTVMLGLPSETVPPKVAMNNITVGPAAVANTVTAIIK